MNHDISAIISSALEKPLIKTKCTIMPNLSFDSRKYVEQEISRMLGYCILFKTSDEIEEYMKLPDEDTQKRFLKEKIAVELGIAKEDIDKNNEAIISYIWRNLNVEGYVFHAANSVSAENDAKQGLKGGLTDFSHIQELLHIASIYKKYGAKPPFMYAMNDSKYNKKGWFYDGSPENITYYADSPEWFNQFTGGSIEYASLVDNSRRCGYQLRDHDMAREAVLKLIEKNNMSESDKKEILVFFEKIWGLYGQSRPNLLLIPTKAIFPTEQLDPSRKFEGDDANNTYLDLFLGNVLKCRCSYDYNQCCHIDVHPELLSRVDLSPILPKPNLSIQQSQPSEREMALEACMKMLQGFNLEELKQAETFLASLGKEKKKTSPDIGSIISEALQSPIVKEKCTILPNQDFLTTGEIKKNISRMIGYCILFKTSDGIEEYMQLDDTDKQRAFLTEKVATTLGIPIDEISQNRSLIISYIKENFYANGYVFHSTNSKSANSIMREGLKGNIASSSNREELQIIADIFKKYGNTSTFTLALADLSSGNIGWFYEGNPSNISYYVDSPEWFNQFTGGASSYSGLIPQDRRCGYRLRDYDMAKEAVSTLAKSCNMSDEDYMKVMSFFEKKWKEYGNTRPSLVLVPIQEVAPEFMQSDSEEISDSEDELEYALLDVIESYCILSDNSNCDKDVDPEILSCVDLSPIFPKPNLAKDMPKEELSLQGSMKFLRGSELPELNKAERFFNLIEGKEPPKNDIQ